MAKKIQGEDGQTYVQKKPFYKKWWFWIIVVVLVIGGFSGMGNDDDSSTTSSSSNHTGTSKTSITKKAEKNTAKAVTLNAGSFKVGTDVQPGRYVVKATNGSGNFMNESGSINVILGSAADDTLGQVDSYTVNLVKNEEIKLDGIQSASFTPTPSKRNFQTTLSAGVWEVGKDIKAGRYEITANQGSGNLMDNSGSINEILGTSADSDAGQVTKVTVNLHDGQKLTSDLQSIQLTKK
ncbi:hypothetical protein [Paucilactobacillus sp. N302-9]